MSSASVEKLTSTPIARLGPAGFDCATAGPIRRVIGEGVISAKGGALSFGGNFYKSVAHPGAKPHPFMRPALDTKWREAIEAIGASLAGSIEKHLPEEGNS